MSLPFSLNKKRLEDKTSVINDAINSRVFDNNDKVSELLEKILNILNYEKSAYNLGKFANNPDLKIFSLGTTKNITQDEFTNNLEEYQKHANKLKVMGIKETEYIEYTKVLYNLLIKDTRKNDLIISKLLGSLLERTDSRDLTTISNICHNPYVQMSINNIFSRSKLDKDYNPVILDLGCGKGTFLFDIKNRMPKIKAIGIGLQTPDCIYSDKEKIEFIAHNLEKGIPKELKQKSSIDMITSRFSMQYMPNWPELLPEIKEILNNTGNAYLNIGNNHTIDPKRIKKFKELNTNTNMISIHELERTALDISGNSQEVIYYVMIISGAFTKESIVIPPYDTELLADCRKPGTFTLAHEEFWYYLSAKDTTQNERKTHKSLPELMEV